MGNIRKKKNHHQNKMSSKTALVTGSSGYIALNVVNLLLKDGWKVKGTVRSLKNEDKIAPIKKLATNSDQLELVEADILDSDCWKNIVKDVDVVFHMASPFPLAQPKNDDEVIKPAVNGTLNVLKACLDTNVKRVVLTSSGYAVFDDEPAAKLYSEKDWARPEKHYTAYGRSKLLAETCAWELLEERKKNNQSCFELAVVNPTFVMGPLLSKVYGASGTMFQMSFMSGVPPMPIMNMYMPCCDVRDVALAHLRAATLPEAAGQRHLICSDDTMKPVVRFREILAKEFNPKGMDIKTEPLDANEGPGKNTRVDNSRMRNVLKIEPIDFNKTIIDMAHSFIDLGLAKV